MIKFYQIRSPLTQVTEEHIDRYIAALSRQRWARPSGRSGWRNTWRMSSRCCTSPLAAARGTSSRCLSG